MASPVYERLFNEFGAFKPSSGYEVLKNDVSGWKLPKFHKNTITTRRQTVSATLRRCASLPLAIRDKCSQKASMRPLHIRKKRPTLKDAHAVASGREYDGTSATNYICDKERMEEAEKVVDELQATVKDHFPKTRNLEYAVLKTHLIVEYALTQFIRCSFPVYIEPEDVDFRFAQKITLAYLHGFTDCLLLPCVELLNRARNQVAHRFTLDRRIIDELVRLLSEDYETFSITNDIERIRGLRQFCYLLCGILAGKLSARIEFSMKETQH